MKDPGLFKESACEWGAHRSSVGHQNHGHYVHHAFFRGSPLETYGHMMKQSLLGLIRLDAVSEAELSGQDAAGLCAGLCEQGGGRSKDLFCPTHPLSLSGSCCATVATR